MWLDNVLFFVFVIFKWILLLGIIPDAPGGWCDSKCVNAVVVSQLEGMVFFLLVELGYLDISIVCIL